MDCDVVLTKEQKENFISLSKTAGMSRKQVESILPISPDALKYQWQKVRLNRVPKYLKVHRNHKGMIVELLLAELDLFTISRIFNYMPATVLQFVERECTESNWRVRTCRICGDHFISFDERRVCHRMGCFEEDRIIRKGNDRS
jgi:hypothetical protein